MYIHTNLASYKDYQQPLSKQCTLFYSFKAPIEKKPWFLVSFSHRYTCAPSHHMHRCWSAYSHDTAADEITAARWIMASQAWPVVTNTNLTSGDWYESWIVWQVYDNVMCILWMWTIQGLRCSKHGSTLAWTIHKLLGQSVDHANKKDRA